MTLPTISIVIPLYNHDKYITNALYSVITQTLPPAEIIVIDDGSTDNSAKLVSAIADVRPEITFWSHPNRGAHNTINAGIHRASSDLVAILNSDDVYEPTRLQRAAETFQGDPTIDVVATGLQFIDGASAQISNDWFEAVSSFYRECNDLGLALVNGNFLMTTSNIIARRSLFEDVGFFADLRYAHDLDFFLRIVSHGKRIAYLEDRLLNYRFHGSNTISESHAKVKIEWAACVAIYLKQIWASQGSQSNWADSERYVSVIRKHNLLELVILLMAYFAKHNIITLERNIWQRDPEFMAALESVQQ